MVQWNTIPWVGIKGLWYDGTPFLWYKGTTFLGMVNDAINGTPQNFLGWNKGVMILYNGTLPGGK